MNAEHGDSQVSEIAASIGESASVHPARLKEFQLVKVRAQGKHRCYSLADLNVARALEALSVVAGGASSAFVPNTPSRLRTARTCYADSPRVRRETDGRALVVTEVGRREMAALPALPRARR
jgi:hypothetical protein